MIGIIALIIGICLITVRYSLISSVSGTPQNLRGFYGGFYSVLSVFGLTRGAGFVLISFIV